METSEKDKDFSKLFHNIIDDGTWSKLSFKAQAVYPVILRYAHYSSRKAFPIEKTIAEKSGITEESARDAIKELMGTGYLSKKRGGSNIGFRNIYTVHKEPQRTIMHIQDNILRLKTVKCKTKRDELTGKFIPKVAETVDYSREKTAADTSGENHGNKENNREIVNRDSTGSALACQGQASPAKIEKPRKSMSQVSKETLIELRDSLGGEEALRQYLLKNGYPEEEIDSFLKLEVKNEQNNSP